MKIKKQDKKINYKLALIIALVLIGVACAAIYYLSQSTERSVPAKNQETRTHSSNDVNQDQDSSTGSDNSEKKQADNENPNKVDVTTPATPIDTDKPYPVVNEHFKIQQINIKHYSITLYPIANNPEFSDYNSQLVTYKQEALDYLKKRHGLIADLQIDWTPQDAKNL